MEGSKRTFQLTLSEEAFEEVTRAVMLQSNRAKKLQGFGQCLNAWLVDWRGGDIVPECESPRLDHVDADDRHAIWVALAGDFLKLLLTCRADLSSKCGKSVTVAATIFAIVDAFLQKAERNRLKR